MSQIRISLLRILKESAWNSRGWTFQEAILSRRCLFFTEEQASLVCRKEHTVESISLVTESLQWGAEFDIFRVIAGADLPAVYWSFDSFVNHYQQRQLSFDSDALNAFKGLLSLAPTQSYYGILLPRSTEKHTDLGTAFAFGLLWRAREIEEHPGELRKHFPSWSWLSRRHIRIDSELIGHRSEVEYENPLQRALCMWIADTKRTRVATICTDTRYAREGADTHRVIFPQV